MRSIVKLLTVITLAVALMYPRPAASAHTQQRVQPKFPEKMKEQIKYLSTGPMLLRAATMGISVIEGKDINSGKAAKSKRGRGHDVRIGVALARYGVCAARA